MAPRDGCLLDPVGPRAKEHHDYGSPATGRRFLGAAFKENPYPLYEEVRAVGNVVWNDQLPGWMVVGFDESLAVLINQGECFAQLAGDPEMNPWFEAPNMITVDGPYHRQLRGALSPLFTRRRTVAKWERRVGEVVEGMLAPLVAGHDRFDLISDFTLLPTVIVADMLGVPPERYDDFRRIVPQHQHQPVVGLRGRGDPGHAAPDGDRAQRPARGD